MKTTSKILLFLLFVLLFGALESNIILKKEYDHIDKSDIYWTYQSVLRQPFRHIKIMGGNNSNIVFEQSANSSVRIFQNWKRNFNGDIKAHVYMDTLFIDFDYVPNNEYSKAWMKERTTVRIFSPELLSIEGFNTNFRVDELRQKNIKVIMSGKSTFEVESMIHDLDLLDVFASDSSRVIFEMSPNFRSTDLFTIKNVNAHLNDVSFLDLGHAQIDSLKLDISLNSGIILSGGVIKQISKSK